MSCPGCREARSNPRTHVMYLGCEGCESRALACSHPYEESSKAGAMTREYRKALGSVFGERWKDGHTMVKRWAEKMKDTR